MFNNNHNNMNKREKREAAAQVAAEAQIVENATAEAQPKQETMAAFLDRLIAEGGEVEAIVSAAKAEAATRGVRTKFNAGVIKGHINFRTKQAEKKAAKAQAEVTEEA